MTLIINQVRESLSLEHQILSFTYYSVGHDKQSIFVHFLK